MSYVLLWIEVLASALLWMALLAACVARIKRRWMRTIWMAPFLIVSFFPFAVFVFEAGVCRFYAKVENNWLIYATTLLIGVFAGLVVILILARPRQAGMAPGALAWRRGPLAAAWLASIALVAMTLWNMDLAIRARANVLALEADALWLASSPAVPSDDQNAAILYEKAFARLRDDPPRDVNSAPTGSSSTFDPKEPAMIAFLARQASTLALLRQAAAMPACRFDDDLATPDIAQLMPQLDDERGAVNDLRLEVRHELAEGHVSNAIADINAIFKMSRHFGQRPLLISGLVAIGIDTAAAHELREALPAVTRPEEIAGLNLQSLTPIRRMSWRTLQGEERFGLDDFSGVGYAGLSLTGTLRFSSEKAIVSNPMARIFILPDELDAYLQIMNTYKQTMREPYFKAAQQRVRIEDSYNPGRPHKGFLVPLLIPSMTRYFQNVAKAEASDACAQVAVAATRYRLDHAKLPDHLADLVPAYLDSIPLDPFDGQPLRMIVKNDQWIIYSIGTSATNEGANTIPDSQKGNVVFVLKASAPATRP